MMELMPDELYKLYRKFSESKTIEEKREIYEKIKKFRDEHPERVSI